MGVHGDDVVRTIRLALAAADIAPTQTTVETTPDQERGWPSRDGRHEFVVVGRDWFRQFRITVEVEDVEAFERAFVAPEAWTVEQDAELRDKAAVAAAEAERARLAELPTLDEWAAQRD